MARLALLVAIVALIFSWASYRRANSDDWTKSVRPGGWRSEC